jgi:hypothetical protein
VLAECGSPTFAARCRDELSAYYKVPCALLCGGGQTLAAHRVLDHVGRALLRPTGASEIRRARHGCLVGI